MSVTAKVMTFNLRVAVEKDGANYFWNRTHRVLDTLKTENPDIIGFQEANSDMRKWLGDALAPFGYTLIGCGRKSNLGGEGTVVAYRRDLFELIFAETFWLSNTPHVPASTFGGDQSACPRVSTALVLRHKESSAPFLFLNTHLDHKGKIARLLGATQILQYLSGKGLHFVITGDMNALPDSPEIQAFTATPICGAAVTELTQNIKGTFHRFGDLSEAEMRKIDYIFSDLPADPARAYLIPDAPEDGVYISDHRPVVAFVELP